MRYELIATLVHSDTAAKELAAHYQLTTEELGCLIEGRKLRDTMRRHRALQL